MKKRKKRNAITMVSLLLLLFALIGFYVWYSHKPAASDQKDATEDINLATVDASKVTDIHFTGADVDINLVLDNGVWKSKEEPDRPINQDNVNSMLKAISDIKAYQKLDNPDSLSEYGFDKPFAYIQVKLNDGKTVSLKLGSEVSTGNGYYALVNDKPTVYLVAMTYGSGLTFGNLDFTEIEKAPTITAANITYIGIDNRKGDDLELQYQEYPPLDNSGSTLSNWQILKPYGNGYSASNEKVSGIQANYTTFDYADCVDYKGNDLVKYGLDKPASTIDIKYFEEAAQPTQAAGSKSNVLSDSANKTFEEYKIYIGDKTKDGYYYVKVDGSNRVYTLSTDTVDKMLNVDVYSLVTPFILIPNIDTVDKITADISGKTYSMDITRSTTKNSDGKDETKASYSYNGSTVKEQSFKDLYQKLISPVYSAQLKDKVDISALKPVFTLSFHLNGDNAKTVTASYLPYNDSFYIVDKGTGIYFLVDKRTIDDTMSSISNFTGK